MERQTEMMKEFMQQQDKYCYFIISVTVTAIGFSIYQTTGHELNWTQIILALANICWVGSIFCGLRNRAYVVSTIYANKSYLDVIDGIYPGVGQNPKLIKPASEGIMNAMQSNSDKAGKLMDWQERLFYSGIILFIFWHVIEMYRNT